MVVGAAALRARMPPGEHTEARDVEVAARVGLLGQPERPVEGFVQRDAPLAHQLPACGVLTGLPGRGPGVVASFGVVSSVLTTTSSTWSSVIFRGPPDAVRRSGPPAGPARTGPATGSPRAPRCPADRQRPCSWHPLRFPARSGTAGPAPERMPGAWLSGPMSHARRRSAPTRPSAVPSSPSGHQAEPAPTLRSEFPTQDTRTCPADHVRSQMTRAAAVAVPRKT